MTTRKSRGSETQTMLAHLWYQQNGWPYCEPIGAGVNGVDLTGMAGLSVEIKASSVSHFRPHDWLKQAGAHPGVPFVIWRPPGGGPSNIGRWPVIMRLDEHTRLLHAAEYGDRKEIVR